VLHPFSGDFDWFWFSPKIQKHNLSIYKETDDLKVVGLSIKRFALLRSSKAGKK